MNEVPLEAGGKKKKGIAPGNGTITHKREKEETNRTQGRYSAESGNGTASSEEKRLDH